MAIRLGLREDGQETLTFRWGKGSSMGEWWSKPAFPPDPIEMSKELQICMLEDVHVFLHTRHWQTFFPRAQKFLSYPGYPTQDKIKIESSHMY